MEGGAKFIGFYHDQICKITSSFPDIFDQTNQEDEGSGEEGDGEEDKSTEQENTGFNAFSYLTLIKRYSDMTKEQWKDVYDVNVYYFFNIISFSISWDKKEQDYIKKMRQR